MSDRIIELNNISKSYKDNVVLNSINLNIERGKIYGLVGENGAGKTTIMKLLAGLIYKTSGSMRFYGQENANAMQKLRKKMSFMIETPSYFPDMNAYENLWVHFLQRGLKESNKITAVLEFVGLSNSSKKAREFSLGMKQRLAIAVALLDDVEIMILDEPLNGLDPKGIIELRNLIKLLNEKMKMTFIISSHILDELHRVATDYIFIKQGNIVKEINAQTLNDLCMTFYILAISDIASTEKLLKSQNVDFKTVEEKIYISGEEDIRRISKELCDNKIYIYELYQSQVDIEDYYLELMKK